jgi:hypothetical protein
MSTEPIVDTPQQQRQAFVRAFVEHLWVRPGTDRPTVRPQTMVTITAVCALLTVVFGVVQQLFFPPPPSGPVVAAPPKVRTFTAVGGWDCSSASTHGFEVTGRTSAWQTVARGGWAQDGCRGSFVAIPMSGDATKDDQGQRATWWFAPGQGFTTCDVTVYVPASDQYSGARTAQYFALAGPAGSIIAQFTVDQSAQAGRWVMVGRFALGQNGLGIALVNRGKASSPRDRIGVGQVKVTCGNQ